jgi:glutathionylspermidine synthase
MEDRIIELPGIAEEKIHEEQFSWFIEGDNDDYLTSDAILVHQDEAAEYIKASEAIFNLYEQAIVHVAENNLWHDLDIPESIVPLIMLDFERGLPHICGRMDFAGGVDGLPLKLIEFNADTPAILPESVYFQEWMYEPVKDQYKGQYNYLLKDLITVFTDIRNKFPDRPATLLLTSLGFEEDRLNLSVIETAAEAAGFEVDYADLDTVVFAKDGAYLQTDEGYVQYHFMYKMVPWEIIMFEETELMDILVDLALDHDLVILNPAYSIALQAKHMMTILYKLFPDNPYLLPTYDEARPLRGTKYVRKVNFGRMGENIDVINEEGFIEAQTEGDFGHYSRVYQEFAEMYADEDGDIYQASMYMARGNASCLSFRRRDAMIIDDDAEFVSHVLFE